MKTRGEAAPLGAPCYGRFDVCAHFRLFSGRFLLLAPVLALDAAMSIELDEELRGLFNDVLQRSGPTALLLRHAERGPITDLANHHEVLLTDSGIAAATRSGAHLGQVTGASPVVFVHSPVERCAQTARALCAGLNGAGGVGHVAGVIDALGSSYLRDPARVAEAYLAGGKSFIRMWFDGDIPAEVIAPCADVAALQVRTLREAIEVHPIVVAVSHDWNIASIREHHLGARFEDVGWPQFLDGVVVNTEAVYCRRAPR
jgi:broad specificity phosphatase PhoE